MKAFWKKVALDDWHQTKVTGDFVQDATVKVIEETGEAVRPYG